MLICGMVSRVHPSPIAPQVHFQGSVPEGCSMQLRPRKGRASVNASWSKNSGGATHPEGWHGSYSYEDQGAGGTGGTGGRWMGRACCIFCGVVLWKSMEIHGVLQKFDLRTVKFSTSILVYWTVVCLGRHVEWHIQYYSDTVDRPMLNFRWTKRIFKQEKHEIPSGK